MHFNSPLPLLFSLLPSICLLTPLPLYTPLLPFSFSLSSSLSLQIPSCPLSAPAPSISLSLSCALSCFLCLSHSLSCTLCFLPAIWKRNLSHTKCGHYLLSRSPISIITMTIHLRQANEHSCPLSFQALLPPTYPHPCPSFSVVLSYSWQTAHRT